MRTSTETGIEIELLPFEVSAGSSTKPHLQREIVCQRPYREAGPRLEIEERAQRSIIHCYGHGGSGWTLGPGSGRRILDHVLARAPGADITIVGAGVIGLFAAYYLSRHRQQVPGSIGVITLVAERFEDLASHNAGGLFEPFTIGGEPDSLLLADSYRFFHDLALGRAEEPEFGEFDIELLNMFSDERDVMPSLVELGYIPHGVPATMKVRDKTWRTFLHQVFFMDVHLLMRHLLEIVTRCGVRAIRGVRIDDFSQIHTPVIVNCTGLGSRELARDDTLHPIVGHLIRFQHQPRGLLDVDHDLHVDAGQRTPLLEAIRTFLERTSARSILDLLEQHSTSPGNIVELRFRSGVSAMASAMFGELFALLGDLDPQLPSRSPTRDPDFAGLTRIRVFDDQAQRNRFVDALSLIIRVAELEGDQQHLVLARELWLAHLPRHSKRYILLLEQDFPVTADPEKTYPGLSYFMPIRYESIVRDQGGRYRYASEHAAGDGATVGVAGGTTLDREELDLATNQLEFDRILERLRHLGF